MDLASFPNHVYELTHKDTCIVPKTDYYVLANELHLFVNGIYETDFSYFLCFISPLLLGKSRQMALMRIWQVQ